MCLGDVLSAIPNLHRRDTRFPRTQVGGWELVPYLCNNAFRKEGFFMGFIAKSVVLFSTSFTKEGVLLLASSHPRGLSTLSLRLPACLQDDFFRFLGVTLRS